MYKKIAFVKTGWSDSYQGEAVFGRHDYISKYKEAHERFNFLPTEDGRFFGYMPPIGKKERSPQPSDIKGWLVMFVAAERGKGPLKVVGWYEDAIFKSEYSPRPEYKGEACFETDVSGNEYTYCVYTNKAILVPSAQRTETVSGAHFRRSPIVYVRQPSGKRDSWRIQMADSAEQIIARNKPVQEESGEPIVGFPDAEHRKKVEKAAIEAVSAFLQNEGYSITDKQRSCCGYDLLAVRKRHPKELHVEVKGTSTSVQHFFMTKNERNYMQNPKWRLAMVTNALEHANIEILSSSDVKDKFEFSTLAWDVKVKSA